MADLNRYLLIDATSGTVLCAQHCYLVNDDNLSLAQWDAMESMSDAEICALARNYGQRLEDVVRLRPQLPGETF
jgi:hypothetical protein